MHTYYWQSCDIHGNCPHERGIGCLVCQRANLVARLNNYLEQQSGLRRRIDELQQRIKFLATRGGQDINTGPPSNRSIGQSHAESSISRHPPITQQTFAEMQEECAALRKRIEKMQDERFEQDKWQWRAKDLENELQRVKDSTADLEQELTLYREVFIKYPQAIEDYSNLQSAKQAEREAKRLRSKSIDVRELAAQDPKNHSGGDKFDWRNNH